MATYDEVMQALRNADAAGDVEAARRLAEIASEMMQGMGQPQPLSAVDVAAGAVRNFPSSAMGLVSDLVTAVTSPIQTAKTVLDLGAGVLQAVLPERFVQAVGEDKQSREVARKVGEFYKDRYGSVEGAKKAIAEDPAGVLADAATVLYGGGAALRTGALATQVGTKGAVNVQPVARAGEAVSRLGSTIDPLGVVARTATGALAPIAGITTGAGPEAIRQAFEAGKAGGERGRMFRENISGAVPQENVLAAAKQNLSVLRNTKSSQYRSGMVDISKDKTILSFDKIDEALSKAEKRTKYKNEITDAAAFDKVTEAKSIVDRWKALDPAEYHTPEGMDALKQSIGSVLEGLDPKTNAYNTVNDIYGSVKSEIVKQAPVYANVMSDYTKATDQIREIEKSLSLGNKASADTAMRKLQSLMRDNVQTNYGQRVRLARQLEEKGGQMMMPGIAGQALQSVVPRGMSQVTGTGLTGYLGFQGMLPQAVGMAALSSPRLMGETAYGLGVAARPVAAAGRQAPFLLTPELYNLLIQSGQAQQLQE
jgi:hypothetical protein